MEITICFKGVFIAIILVLGPYYELSRVFIFFFEWTVFNLCPWYTENSTD